MTIIAACIPVLYTVFRTLLGIVSTKASRSTGRTASYAHRRKYGYGYGYDSSYGTGSRLDRSAYREIDYEMQTTERTVAVVGGRTKTSDDVASEDEILANGGVGIVRTTEMVVSSDRPST